MKRIDATIFFDNEGARTTTTIWVEDNATEEEIEEKLKEEALEKIEFDWHEHVDWNLKDGDGDAG